MIKQKTSKHKNIQASLNNKLRIKSKNVIDQLQPHDFVRDFLNFSVVRTSLD